MKSFYFPPQERSDASTVHQGCSAPDIFTIVGRAHFTKSKVQKWGSPNNHKLGRIITPGVHSVEIAITHGVMHMSQQSCTSSTLHDVYDVHVTLPFLLRRWQWAVPPYHARYPRRSKRRDSANALTCCRTFSLLFSALRDWLGKMMAAAERHLRLSARVRDKSLEGSHLRWEDTALEIRNYLKARRRCTVRLVPFLLCVCVFRRKSFSARCCNALRVGIAILMHRLRECR